MAVSSVNGEASSATKSVQNAQNAQVGWMIANVPAMSPISTEQWPPGTNLQLPQLADHFDIPHLRLLQNWTSSTCHTISRNDTDSSVWENIIPQQALSHPYLFHGIFAISALHLAVSEKQDNDGRKKLITVAEYHQSKAITSLTRIIGNMQLSQLNASFALSTLLVGFAFAFPLAVTQHAKDASNPLEEMIELAMFIRKTMDFSAPMMESIQAGEMGQILHIDEAQWGLTDSSRLAIMALYELNMVHSSCHENFEVFTDTLNHLEKLLANLDSGGDLVSASFMWICEVPAEFFWLVRGRDPVALVILAHYSVILHRLRDRWWVSSWGQRVLMGILDILSADWKPSIDWALKVANLDL
ncbi:hypothetical protein FE257_000818 [Aspergillus nanangensis]|uniref:Uncharacterized protein n=1 Tax=Aspergillus nanangensis TaxID=2582783 RepID=A0AAD4GQ19_ASPNN|nr:hypothetical protein FE257_000818 [Aspergillus nanangensis]